MLETNALTYLQGQLPRANAAASKDHAKAWQTAQEFESVYLSTVLSSMFSGISTEAPFGGGHAEETYRGLLIEEYGKSITGAGGVGIADSIYRELISIQEGAQS
ncbi:rod-binding protein [Coralliovum pocilloporae]|uniref:rod-binding protein n=1 Tax=Coralliovum pocilloporae TaxID=3066369 RepID=UPI003307323C